MLDVELTQFAEAVASSNVVTSNLLKVGYEDAAMLAIRKKTTYDPIDFLEILQDQHFLAAREWILFDPDEYQASIVENLDYIFDNLFQPDTIQMGLFIFRKFQKRNQSYECGKRFLHIWSKFFTRLDKWRNPILIAVLFAELLKGGLRCIYLKAAVELEKQLYKKWGNYHSLEVFYDKDFDGRWLIRIINDINARELINTESVKALITREWNGPYKTQLIPYESSSIWYWMQNPQFWQSKTIYLPRKQHEFPFSLKVWMMATYPKMVYSALVDLTSFILIIVWASLNLGTDAATEWWILPDDEKKKEDWPIEERSDELLYYQLGLYGLVWVQDMFIFSNARLNHVQLKPTNLYLYTSGIAFALQILWRVNLSPQHIRGEEFREFQTAVILSVLAVASLRLLMSLKSTELFGLTIKNLYWMWIRSIAFGLFLIASIVAWSSYILITQMFKYEWSINYSDTFVYMFGAMLGNYEAEDWIKAKAGWQAILILNLLIAVLSDVYAQVNASAAIDVLMTQLQLSTMYTPHEKYSTLTINPAPVNALALPFLPLLLWDRAVNAYNHIVSNGFYMMFLAPLCIVGILSLNIWLILPAYFLAFKFYLNNRMWKQMFKWIVLGLFQLLWMSVKDTYEFLKVCKEPPTQEIVNKTQLYEQADETLLSRRSAMDSVVPTPAVTPEYSMVPEAEQSLPPSPGLHDGLLQMLMEKVVREIKWENPKVFIRFKVCSD